MRLFLFCILILPGLTKGLQAQAVQAFFAEGFDSVSTPDLPRGWSAEGFSTSTVASKSDPNNVFATGNRSEKYLTSPPVDFSGRFPESLTFFERRSNTARTYRLELRILIGASDSSLPLASFNDIHTTSSYVLREVDLRGIALGDFSPVQFQWLLHADSTNNTGVIRIDDVTVAVTPRTDLAVSHFTVTPSYPDHLTEFALSATIVNSGVSEASMFSVAFFRDLNTDGFPDPTERFFITSGHSLATHDSTIVAATHPPLTPGDHSFLAFVEVEGDEAPYNNTAALAIRIGIAPGSLVVNEIMYAPVGDEPEWIEFLNTLDDSLNLNSWHISDSNTDRMVILTSSDVFVAPKSLVVVAKNDDFITLHPSVTCPVIVASFSSLNNATADAVVVFDDRREVIDSVWYDPAWGGQNGRSLERIDESISSIDPANWGISVDSAGKTPGQTNSIARLTHDLTIGDLRVRSLLTPEGQEPLIEVKIVNNGRQSASGYSILFHADRNLNARGEEDERLFEVSPSEELERGDSLRVQWEYTDPPPGRIMVIVELVYEEDMRPSNNIASVLVAHRYETRTLVINEIMYDPLDGQTEWIELYHRGAESIDLQEWTMEDGPSEAGNVNRHAITTGFHEVRPGEFVVVAAESSIVSLFPVLADPAGGLHSIILDQPSGLGLGNTGDVVIVRDLTGAIIDSVRYSPAWHNPELVDTKGRSIERIHPDLPSNDRRNWSTATSTIGGSPGLQNSIFTAATPVVSSLSLNPNPFSPDADGFEDFCMISYSLPTVTAVIRVRVYDIRGRMIRKLADHELSGSVGQILWDGNDDSGRRARIGPYVVLLEAIDSQGALVTTEKAVVVVATKL